MDIHPLAEMFPSISELELSNLVARVKASGQGEPIVAHRGQILDGRDTFYACGIAGIEPAITEYAGDDPIASLVESNLRRHPQLNPSQRGLIAAQMTPTERRGGYALKLRPASDLTLERAAELFDVSIAMVSLGRLCLARATPEQLAAVRAGHASVGSIGQALRGHARKPRRAASPPDGAADSQAARAEQQQLQAQMWGHLRDAIEHLAELPLPSEVAAVARAHSGRAAIIDRRLEKSIKWLEEFADVWRNRDQAAA